MYNNLCENEYKLIPNHVWLTTALLANAELMLISRLSLWLTINNALDKCLMFAGLIKTILDSL